MSKQKRKGGRVTVKSCAVTRRPCSTHSKKRVKPVGSDTWGPWEGKCDGCNLPIKF